MNRDTMTWTIIFVIGLALILIRIVTSGGLFGKAYVKAVPREYAQVAAPGEDENWIDVTSEEALDYDLTQIPADERITWTSYNQTHPIDYANAMAADPNQSVYQFSFWRTFGIWLSAFFTLAIFSFLYKDNPFYKIAESVVVGVSAAYWMVVGFWSVIIPNLFGKIYPESVQSWAMPGLTGESAKQDLWYLIPLILGVMLLWRLAPKGAWIARWPLAFIIGTTAGMRLMGFLHGDFISQIRNSITSIYVKTAQIAADGTPLLDAAGLPVMGFDFWESLRSIIIIIGVLSCLVYFFFSFEHKGIVGKTAKLGIWFLMITFGAAFGFTVMGRIALLAIRLEFLFDDWLWLLDPSGKRLADTVGLLMQSFPMLT